MAASTKKRPRRYHTPGVVSGNLARELNHQELERRRYCWSKSSCPLVSIRRSSS